MAETKTATPAISAPPPPSVTASEAIKEHLDKGRSLFDPRTGKNLEGSRHISVNIAPERTALHESPPTAETHDAFVTRNHDILAKHVNSAVRSSYEPETGIHKLEVVGLTPSKTSAIDMAQHLGEKHVFNHATGEKIPTGSTGHNIIPSVSADDKFQHLRENSPKKEDYSGTHFSDRAIHLIEGARRGMPAPKGVPADSDAARVRLGSKTGMGPDAPAGFYTQKAGSIANLATATKPHSYHVRGQFAFGSTDHPAFQQGYAAGSQKATAAGADPKTAHGLGLNTAEHAMQDAGFDGYFSAKHPNVRFHFGDHPAVAAEGHDAPKEGSKGSK